MIQQATYEPPALPFDHPYCRNGAWKSAGRLGVGVDGLAFFQKGTIYIPLIIAHRPGSGDVGRFLDRLSSRCRIVDVVSERLREMLGRRGWKIVEDETLRECEVWQRSES